MAYIEKRGDSWRATIRRKGFPTQTKTFPKKGAAEKWVRETEAAMDGDAFVVPAKVTVEDIFLKYRKEVVKPDDRWTRNRILQLLAQFDFRLEPANLINHEHIKRWRDARLKEVSGSTVNREWNVIGGIYTYAIKEWGVISGANPTHTVKRPVKNKSRVRRISPKEFSDLRTYFGCNVDNPPRLDYGSAKDLVWWVVEFAIETGMRLGEILALTYENVHLDEFYVFVEKSKNGDSRNVPLSERAEAILRLMRGNLERPFPVNSGTLGVYFRDACKELGIEDLHFHDTRHEAASRLAMRLNVQELAAVIGHRDLRSLMVYYNPTASELSAKLRSGSATPPISQHQPVPIEVS
jgi:integrase